MKQEKWVSYKEIGQILYSKNPRAKNIAIRISRSGEVRVTIPRYCTFHAAESFVMLKKDWILNKTLFLQRKKNEKRILKQGEMLHLPNGMIEIIDGKKQTLTVERNLSGYRIMLPDGFNPENDSDQEKLQLTIIDIGLHEARKFLPALLLEVANIYRYAYQRVTVRKMKSRWGSCSVTNKINLNSALIFLPLELIEYVLLHELVHTVHKNHGQEFWGTVERHMPDAKAKRKLLKKSGMVPYY